MKTNTNFAARLFRRCRHGLTFAGLAAALAPLAAGAQSAGSFVQEIQFPNKARIVDVRVDNSVGTPKTGITYVLATDTSSAYLRKFDASGAAAFFITGTNVNSATNQIVIPGINPTAMMVAAGTTNLFLIGGANVFVVSTEDGSVIASKNAGSGVTLNNLFWVGTSVYVCGSVGQGTASVFGQSVTTASRGQQAAVVAKLSADLQTTLNVSTFGCDGSNAVNTANSVVVDENGDVFVGGQLGAGSFHSDSLTANAFAQKELSLNSGWTTTPAINSIENGLFWMYSWYPWPQAFTYSSTSITNINFGSAPAPEVKVVTGYINAPSAGTYIFNNTTDDGARLYVDSTLVINDDANHGALTTSGTNYLSAGLHHLEWDYFNGGGPGSGQLTWVTPAGGAATFVTPADIGSLEGYVFKMSGDLTQIEGYYSSIAGVSGISQGGAINELAYRNGFVYGVGYWQGQVNTNATGQSDSSYSGAKNIEVLKLDTDLKLKKRATVKGTHDSSGYSLTVDEGNNVYFTGSEGPSSSDFFGNSDAPGSPFATIAAAKASIFIAQLDSGFHFTWVQTPDDPQPDFDFTQSIPRARWNTRLQRVFWADYFSGSLTMGNASTLKTLTGPENFLAVLEPDGSFTERVLLTILSDYGVSGTQVMPFGAPAPSSNNVVALNYNTEAVIKGSQIAASVPAFIYRDYNNNDISSTGGTNLDSIAATRITCTGYTVGNNVANGVANNYTFTIAQDTIIRFNWLKEYALDINADFTDTAGLDSPGTPGHIIGLSLANSGAAGSPNPTVQRHWVQDGTPVTASVDSAMDDQDYLSQGLAVRYVVDGYVPTGTANTYGPGYNKTLVPFVGHDSRWQVPQFSMTAAASITYHWKLKIGVQVGTTGLKSATYPLIHVVADPGQLPPTQSEATGSGTFFYDQNTSLQIGSLQNLGTTQLQGWLDGDGTVFASSGQLSDLNSTYTTNGQTYAALSILQLKRPARVIWNYGDRIFDETVTLGNYVMFTNITDPSVATNMLKTSPPANIQVLSGPQGSSGNDMTLWDSVGKKLYPLRPGVVMTYWQTLSGNTNDQVALRLTQQYPAAPHYRHIANTRGVSLNPQTNGLVTFVGLKYTESTTGAAVDSSTNFTATGPGKTILLFNVTSSSGRGGSVTTPRVRVVQSMNWSDNLPATQTAVIGKKITSTNDTAGLGTGYLFFPNAPYNASIYSRNNLTGPIIPVNLNPGGGANGQLVVVWYEIRDTMLWPYQAVRYQPAWPVNAAQGLNRIVIASRYGNESVAPDGIDQVVVPAETYGTNTYPAETTFNPARFSSVQVYNQPNSTLPGYNPNEEHALLAPSLRSAAVAPQPQAVYALRTGDLNVTNQNASYTSDPYVLVQFYDNVAQQYRMCVYNITATASNLNLGTLSYNYTFEQEMTAGEPVVPFYPLPQVIGATPSSSTYGKDGQPTNQICYWKDHKGTGWAVSGESFFTVYYYYPLLPDFWWPAYGNKNPGDGVSFLPKTPGDANPAFAIDYTRNDQTPAAQGIKYTTVWPDNVPILKVGETLTFSGGEYQLDNPTTTEFDDQGNLVDTATPGLPGVVGFAAGQVVFDTMNPTMNDQLAFNNYTARIFPALEERTVPLSVADFPTVLLPANGRTTVKNGIYIFNELPSSLQKRMFYDPIRAVLGIKGLLNNKDISDSTLTASPPAVYVLEPNILTGMEKTILDGAASTSPFKDVQGSRFTAAMDALFNLTRNPNKLDQSGDGVDTAYRVGLEQKVKINPSTGLPLTTQVGTVITVQRDATKAANMQALGPGLAMTANANFLDPANTNMISYVTVAENNSDALGGAPVAMHVIKVDKNQRYRGSIETILSANAFDENITLRHTADFGGNADDLVFEWWYRPDDGTTALPPDRQPSPSPWKLFADPTGNQGQGFYQLTLKGNPSAPEALLGDTFFFVRYRHKNETVNGVNWEVTQPNGERRRILGVYTNGIPYDWAGAGNSSPSTDFITPGQPDYIAQLAEGWIKRVLTAINPYETRINDFSQDTPAVYSSILQQLGAPYNGPVALNDDPNVIQNTGLIQLYQTILNRGESLSINLSTPITGPSIANALELVSTRLSEFYLLLGNEAYADSMNPAIGYGSGSVEYGNMAPSVFAFENQLASRLDEELGLLRGENANNGTPVFNRLYWNFTHDEGEAAYAMKYNITDINKDGFIDVKDAMTLYPQGHGDAWGHYLTAERMQYDLLRNPYFNWVSRSEYINSQDVVIPVDYLDERKFAKVAAAKAQAGAQILNLTYRQKYVADPRGQWQGYLDTDQTQAWGVEEWSRRSGQGALFDWVTANALLPAVHPNTNYTGIQKVDRTTVTDITTISANFISIQETMDQVDHGNNPLGLHNGALSFAIDPTFAQNIGSSTGNSPGQDTFFEQTYAKAVAALVNAKASFDNANQYNNLLRQVANSQADLQNEIYEQDLSYRNQMIEIFGTPYPGTIGSGKLYPAGYQGPDLALYNYVNVNNVNDSTVPQPSLAFVSNLQSQTGAGASIFQHQSFVDINSAAWQQQFNLTILNGQANQVNYADFSSNSVPTNQMLQNLQLPVMANGYSYVAPTAWGQRGSVGQLQKNIGDMVQAQADLAHEINVWQQISSDMINKLTYMNQKFEWDNNIYNLQITKGSLDIAFDTAKGAADLAKNVLDFLNQDEEEAGKAVAEMIPTMTPEVGLADSAGDVLAPARGGIEIAVEVAQAATQAGDIAVQSVGLAADIGKAISDLTIDTQINQITAKEELLNSLYEVQALVKQEADQRIAVFKAVQTLKSAGDDYRTTLANGTRLLQERSNYNKKVAAQNQQAQYEDITFRFSRNAALEQYRSTFDLASRYAYLAASAYDYDLNLGPDDPGSPLGIMADIIHQRSIGFVDDSGTPQVGGKGLAEDLATLSANYSTLSARMGIINPIQENQVLSLRSGNFKSATDSDWQATLNNCSVSNLWDVPQFRRYCRSFAPETNGPQPGLVIPFTSIIKAGQNFFGGPLLPGDVSYDPSVYSTRIASLAVGLNGYDNTQLASTPRVYLIPAGADVMTIPNSQNHDVRYYNVCDQNIPIPYPATQADFSNPDWRPFVDSVTDSSGTFGDIRQYSSFMANMEPSIYDTTDPVSFSAFDQRLIGRSVWNTQWLLIIPGASLLNDPSAGVQNFINTVNDIQLNIKTYGYSGN